MGQSSFVLRQQIVGPGDDTDSLNRPSGLHQAVNPVDQVLAFIGKIRVVLDNRYRTAEKRLVSLLVIRPPVEVVKDEIRFGNISTRKADNMREEQFFEVTTAALAEVGITDPAFSPGWYYHGENDISGLSDVFADSYTRPHGSPVRDNIIGPFASIENNQK